MNKRVLFDNIRKAIFGGRMTQKQVEGVDFLVDFRAKNYPKVTDDQFAYILATTYWETAHTMQPVTEYGGQKYLRAKSYWPFIGRGYVQLTWKRNYERFGIASTPEKALEPTTAARILFDGMLAGAFGGRLGTYISGGKCDFVGARHCVNGTDRAREIAGIAKKFQSAIVAAEKAPADLVESKARVNVEEPSFFDEVLDTIDWTRHPQEDHASAGPSATVPTLKGQAGYVLAAIIAAVAAINQIDEAEWTRTVADPSGHLPMIFTGIAIAIGNAVLPVWARWMLPKAPRF